MCIVCTFMCIVCTFIPRQQSSLSQHTSHTTVTMLVHRYGSTRGNDVVPMSRREIIANAEKAQHLATVLRSAGRNEADEIAHAADRLLEAADNEAQSKQEEKYLAGLFINDSETKIVALQMEIEALQEAVKCYQAWAIGALGRRLKPETQSKEELDVLAVEGLAVEDGAFRAGLIWEQISPAAPLPGLQELCHHRCCRLCVVVVFHHHHHRPHYHHPSPWPQDLYSSDWKGSILVPETTSPRLINSRDRLLVHSTPRSPSPQSPQSNPSSTTSPGRRRVLAYRSPSPELPPPPPTADIPLRQTSPIRRASPRRSPKRSNVKVLVYNNDAVHTEAPMMN